MNLEKFMQRGLAAQTAVDAIVKSAPVAQPHKLTCRECGTILTATELYHLRGEHFHVFICTRCHRIRSELHTSYCTCAACLRGEPKEHPVP